MANLGLRIILPRCQYLEYVVLNGRMTDEVQGI
jgi:hypothetical protein